MDFKKKILLVEDSQFQRAICISQLQQAGFENIEIAEDGKIAYSRLEEIEIDLILCDWEMPELNGIQLLKKVKKNPSLKHIPFVMLSSMQDEKICQEALEEGALDYIIKPANPELLKEKLERIS
ncbi:MAG: response regulator [Nitrospinaceae bacterium]|nr:response regulator [Nitrospinaceae bacterium]